MARFHVTRFSYLLVIVLATLVLGTGTIRAMTLSNCGSWTVASSPNAGADDVLYGAAAVPGTNQIWSVGRFDGSDGFYHTLTELWDGSSWSLVPSPNVANTNNLLNGVAVLSVSDVWAVGLSNSDGIHPGLTLIEHWNGSSWSIVSSPNPTDFNFMNAVAAISTNDVWAVGDYENNKGIYKTLTEHWDGTSWSIIASPSHGDFDSLQGATAIATNNVWAVGSFSKQRTQTLIEHWDGSTWSIVSSPNVGKGVSHDNYLEGVTAVSGNANDIWAVGKYYNPGTPHGYHTLVEHWDGSSWKVVKSPDPGGMGGNPILYAVAAVSASDVWAVGYSINPNAAYLTLIVHWDGSNWSVVPSPNPGGEANGDASVLYGVAAASAHNVQAVGYYQTGVFIPTVTLAESYC